MINGKIKVIHIHNGYIEGEIQKFLDTIDIRQIIKINIEYHSNMCLCTILYVGIEDIRNIKINSILDEHI